jgi:hypothetical protein
MEPLLVLPLVLVRRSHRNRSDRQDEGLLEA